MHTSAPPPPELSPQGRPGTAGILESITDAFFGLDTRWQFVFVNHHVDELFKSLGLGCKSLLGRTLWEAFPALVGTPAEGRYRRAMREQVPIEFEMHFGPLNAWFFVRLFPTQSGLSVFLQDISARKEAEAALVVAKEEAEAARAEAEAAREQAEAASRAKDRFLASLSHELRTPLAPVLMTATALLEDDRLPADVRAQLGVIERGVALEARLIDDLLDLSRVIHGKFNLRSTACDMHSLIGQAVTIVQDDAREKGLQVSIDLDAKHFHLEGDAARLQQVLWNLLRNAVKFTPAGGRISVRSHNTEGHLCVVVEDDGIGFDPDAAVRLFNPFEQAAHGLEQQFGGLGLGLAIARAIVELHRGSIRAESPGPGQGARFMVELPGAELGAAAPVTTEESTRASAPADVSLRLLVVEDHEPTRNVLTRVLRRAGHVVVMASSLAEAGAAAEAHAFDAVISDLGLPDGTGHELMSFLRERHGLRGIALSGYGSEEDVRRSREVGFMAHLVKPVNAAELRRALREFAHS